MTLSCLHLDSQTQAQNLRSSEEVRGRPEPTGSSLVAVPAHQQVAPVQVAVLKLTRLLSNCQAQCRLHAPGCIHPIYIYIHIYILYTDVRVNWMAAVQTVTEASVD